MVKRKTVTSIMNLISKSNFGENWNDLEQAEGYQGICRLLVYHTENRFLSLQKAFSPLVWEGSDTQQSFFSDLFESIQ